MTQTNLITLKWFHFNQNNSGGYFIVNDTVAEDVYIQAENAEQATARAELILEPYSEYCHCCGERWSYYMNDDDGYDVPTMYDTPITDVTAITYHQQARLHHDDGTVETYFYTNRPNQINRGKGRGEPDTTVLGPALISATAQRHSSQPCAATWQVNLVTR